MAQVSQFATKLQAVGSATAGARGCSSPNRVWRVVSPWSTNKISKETHADPGGVMVVDLSGSAVQTDAVRSMADMRGFLDLPFATMEKLDYLVFATGEDGCI